jgi:hypothetical protein
MALRGSDGMDTILFGSGVDGVVTFAAPASLTADIYAESVTISADIEPLGLSIFARSRIDHLTGSINANGSNATGGTGGAGAFGTLFGQGGNGGSGGAGAAGGNGDDVDVGIHAVSAGFGPGGPALINPGGAAGSFLAGTFNSEHSIMCPLNHAAVRDGVNPYPVPAGGGTGGGAGGADGGGHVGGGGGGGGGGIILASPDIFLGGDINAKGGNGSVGTGAGGSTGGGGGGKGGWVMLIGHVTAGGGSINVNGGNGANHLTGGFGGKGGGGGQVIFYSSGHLTARTVDGNPGTDGTP